MDKLVLGTLYVDAKPVHYKEPYQGEGLISIGNTRPDCGIPFWSLNGIYVADAVLCPKVTWQALDDNGLIKGTIVFIDGNPYIVRAPKLGSSGEKTEWDDIVAEIGDDPNLWNQANVSFWGQEMVPEEKDIRMIAGGWREKPSKRFFASSSFPINWVGYRPILEPLRLSDLDISQMEGQQVRAYLQDGSSIRGKLVSADEYDLIMEAALDAPSNNARVIVREHDIILDRKIVIWIRRADAQ